MSTDASEKKRDSDWLRNLANTGDAHGVALTRELAREIARSERWSPFTLLELFEQDVDEQQIKEKVRVELEFDKECDLRHAQNSAVIEARSAKKDKVDKFICLCFEELEAIILNEPPCASLVLV